MSCLRAFSTGKWKICMDASFFGNSDRCLAQTQYILQAYDSVYNFDQMVTSLSDRSVLHRLFMLSCLVKLQQECSKTCKCALKAAGLDCMFRTKQKHFSHESLFY